jgi:biotin transport system ATP-binding protein
LRIFEKKSSFLDWKRINARKNFMDGHELKGLNMGRKDFIRISNLSYRFSDGEPGLRDVNLFVEKGELVVLLGQNGSGKTTLLRCIKGLIQPPKGKVAVNGLDVATHLLEARKMVGLVFQEPDAQIVGETVYDDVAFGPENLKLSHDEIQKRVLAALASTGLTKLAHRSPYRLSGGEKRRLAVAGVLAMEPLVVSMDEPFSNLDYPSVLQVRDQLWSLKRSGRTLLVSTHQLDKVMDMADRLVILHEGKVALSGSVSEVGPEVELYGICPVVFP